MSEQIQLSENLKIGILFKEEGKEVSTFKLGEAKLKTGEAIMYEGDTPVQGAAVAIQTTDGWLPAPDGPLELEDGTIIEVSQGLIATVTPAQPAAQAAAPVTPDPNMEQNKETANPAQDAAVERTIESIVKETHFTEAVSEIVKTMIPEAKEVDLTEINTKLQALEDSNKKLSEANENQAKQIGALIELLQKAPAEKPAKTTTTAFSAAGKAEDADAKIMEFINKQNKK